MALLYLGFDPQPCRFPKARLAPFPGGRPRPGDLAGRGTSPATPPRQDFRLFTRARYALFHAYRLSGVGARGGLLAPSYHCRTMLDPAIALGADIGFYELGPDLALRPDRLDAALRASKRRFAAVLATHYFGIEQDLGPLRAWCDAEGIALVEDCSHAFYTPWARASDTLGTRGDYVVSSPYKFLPIPEGGVLSARDPAALDGLRTGKAGTMEEALALARWLRACLERPKPLPGREATASAIAGILRGRLHPGDTIQREESGPSAAYAPEQAQRACFCWSTRIMRRADGQDMARRRRDNYRAWVVATAGLSACEPLFPELPPDCVPYMFPLLLKTPEPDFALLKHCGLPILRWDDIARSDCPVAADYRTRLLHLPCDQTIDRAALQWMIEVVQQVGQRERH